MKQTGVDSSIYFTNLKHNIKLIFGFQMSHEIGFSGKICFYTNLICHAKFSFTQLIFQHKVFSAKFGSGFNFKQIFSAIFSLIFLRKNRSEAFCVSSEKYIAVNVPALCEVASFVTEYFRLLLNFLRKINVNLPHNSQSRKTCVGRCLSFFC